MRRALLILAAGLAVLLAYAGSAAVSLTRAIAAAQAGDSARLLTYVDDDRLRRSIADQVAAAYLAGLEKLRRLNSFERNLAAHAGATIADALIDKLFTAENIAALLERGRVQADGIDAGPISPLTVLRQASFVDALLRVRLIKPVEFSIRVSQSADPDRVTTIHMHFDHAGWRLSGIDLPPRVLRALAERLPNPLG